MSRKYQVLVYVCLALVSIILGFIGHTLGDGTWNAILINLCSELLAVALLFFLFELLIEKPKARQAAAKIYIVLKENGSSQEVMFPVPLRRSEFSRQEVLGIIGMIPRKEASDDSKVGKQDRYKIKYMSDPEFLLDVNRIAAGEGNETIRIRCTEAEMQQLDIPDEWRRQAA